MDMDHEDEFFDDSALVEDYSDDREDLLDCGAVSAEEEAFMKGYEEASYEGEDEVE